MNILKRWWIRRKLLKEMPDGCRQEITHSLDGTDYDCGYGGGLACEYCVHLPDVYGGYNIGDPREYVELYCPTCDKCIAILDGTEECPKCGTSLQSTVNGWG